MREVTKEDYQLLLFRRQFIIGPHCINKFPSWIEVQIGERFFLKAHPELKVTQANNNKIKITLIGYLIDPDNPNYNNQEILNTLLSQIENIFDIFKNTSRLGGRWILILDNGRERILYNDPCGLRSVYYTTLNYQEGWFASQPGIIAEELGLELDEQIENQFIKSSDFNNTEEHWWPGDSSPYKEIKHLIPNFYLNLENRYVKRFWPQKKISSIKLNEAAIKCSELIKKLVISANSRFKLALPLTAGLDSRTILSACRDIKNDVYYYTINWLYYNPYIQDIAIPSRLLSKLGLHHHIIKSPNKMEKKFKDIYFRNVITAHETWGNVAQGLYNHFPDDRVCIKGNVSEIARCFYYYYKYPKNITAETLAILVSMGSNKFVINKFDDWLKKAQITNSKYGYTILDIFYWEQRMGNWQAMSQSEWDIVQEVFTPYNCRELLTTLLNVNKKYRKPPTFELYRLIIKELWSDVLSEPINPKPVKEIIMNKFRKYMLYLFYDVNSYLKILRFSRKLRRKL